MPQKKTTEVFIKEVFALVGDEYSVIGNYIHSNQKILIRHNLCETEWNLTPHNFLRGNRCPTCANKSRSKKLKDSHEDFEKRFNKIFNNEYSLLSKYNGRRSRIKVVHNTCGHTYEPYPTNFLRGDRCGKCYGSLPKTTEEISNRITFSTNGEYSLVGEYKSSNSYIIIKHDLCNNEYKVKATNFLHNNRRCPSCRESKGEKSISSILESLNIKYEKQYTFDDCKNVRKLPFDFAVFNGDKLSFLIEYQGIQHYKENNFFGKKSFIDTKNNDIIKKSYCDKNNIKLLIIPYWDYENIENIIKNAVNN